MTALLRLFRLFDALALLLAPAKRERGDRDEADALRDVLGKRDDRLLDDAGTDRATALRCLGETLPDPRRDWDRWQL